jgi:predicted TIM-barrel fold metal-dependent hydrolase
MHFQPTAATWFDAHVHFSLKKPASQQQILVYQASVKSYPVGKAAVVLPMSRSGKTSISLPHLPGAEPQAAWFLYLDYLHPDPVRLQEGIRAGISGIKLHNAMIITDGADHRCWLSDAWRQVFRLLEEHHLPVLWHVTQRLTDSPYTGGKRNLYWDTGWKKGIRYSNQDLLDVFLEIVHDYPGINFIAAHQLHLGWSRLAALLDTYPNLYTDTSVGCFVRELDTLYDQDRDRIRSFFIRYSRQILFGTDLILPVVPDESSIRRVYDGHIRFIRQLRLPDEVLQLISHQNAERII